MQPKYKLREDAKCFFDGSLHDKILPLETWKETYTVPINLLVKVRAIYLTYGIKGDSISTYMRGWSQDAQKNNTLGYFHFSINFRDMPFEEYERMDNKIPLLMDRIQKLIDDNFKDKL